MVYLLFIFGSFSLIISTKCVEQPVAVATTTYEDVRLGKQLVSTENRTRVLKAETLSACALACSRNSTCLSFNFCDNLICQLNTADIFSTKFGETLLQDNKNCRYGGMKQHGRSECQQATDGEICQEMYKGVDREWGEWEVTSLGIQYWTKDVLKRKPIVDYAHGGDPGSDEDYIELYMLLRREKSWHEAKQNCEDRNGTLLRAVEGNQEELYSFSERLNGTYWLGVYSVFQEGNQPQRIWYDVQGQTVDSDLMNWGVGQPDSLENTTAYVACYHLDHLHDEEDPNLNYLSVCDFRDN